MLDEGLPIAARRQAQTMEPVNYTNWEIVEVRSHKAGHQGLFATTDIPKDTLVGCFAGRCVVLEIDSKTGRYKSTEYEHRQVLQLHRHKQYMVGIVAIGGFRGVDFINHSCRSNVNVINQLVVISCRNIRAGEEITIDYRKWDVLPEGIKCWCENPQCTI